MVQHITQDDNSARAEKVRGMRVTFDDVKEGDIVYGEGVYKCVSKETNFCRMKKMDIAPHQNPDHFVMEFTRRHFDLRSFKRGTINGFIG